MDSRNTPNSRSNPTPSATPSEVSQPRSQTSQQPTSTPSAEGPAKHLWRAILTSQNQLQTLAKNASNPHFKSRYVTLDAIIEGPVKTFRANGVSIVQLPTSGEGFVDITTALCHVDSGEQLSFSTRVTCDTSNAQKVGSGITYARRYALTAVLGIAAESDDDGNMASARPAFQTQNYSRLNNGGQPTQPNRVDL